MHTEKIYGNNEIPSITNMTEMVFYIYIYMTAARISAHQHLRESRFLNSYSRGKDQQFLKRILPYQNKISSETQSILTAYHHFNRNRKW